MDKGFITIGLDEYSRISPFQHLAFQVMDKKIREWRSRQKPMVTY